MPALRNIRQEAFCQEMAKGMSVPAAYEAAGYVRIKANADRLASFDHIRERIRELKGWPTEETVKARVLTVEEERQRIKDELWDNVKRAKDPKKFDSGGANRALELLGKECGMFIEKHENTNTVYAISEEPMSPEEWAEKYVKKDAPDKVAPAAPNDRKPKLN